jgi:hypothetical protein
MQQVLAKYSCFCLQMEKSLAGAGKKEKKGCRGEKFSKNLWIFGVGCDSIVPLVEKAYLVPATVSIKKFPQNVTFLGCHIAREML